MKRILAGLNVAVIWFFVGPTPFALFNLAWVGNAALER